MKRRDFIQKSTLLASGFATMGGRVFAMPDKPELLIKNATIVDGTGSPVWKADILVKDDVIYDLGIFKPSHAQKTIDAEGLHLAPGFIDMHSHSDDDILLYPLGESRITQGITTEVTGNCGSSAAPLVGKDRDKRLKSYHEDGLVGKWDSVESYCKMIDNVKIGLNQALLLGQGTLRKNQVGLVDRPLTTEELKAVLFSLEEGMEQGAFGFSTGLEYTPGTFTPTDELIEMAKVTARQNGLYATHMRDEETLLLSAINEALTIARRSGVRLQISHLKASGKANWDKQIAALDMIESARADGVDVLVDAYPYTAFSTTLNTFLPYWSREGGKANLRKRISEKETRDKIKYEANHKILFELGGYDLIVISSVKTDNNQNLVGKNMQAIAEMWDMDPAEAYLKLLDEENYSVGFVGHGMSPENVDMVLSNPLVMIGSDGEVQAPYGPALENRPHPRSYGTCTRVLGYYCREKKLFDLPTAIKKMTSMQADHIGLKDRGRIARGMKADLVIFDFETVKDKATFADPHQYSSGIVHVLVNGKAVIENGTILKTRPGKILKKV